MTLACFAKGQGTANDYQMLYCGVYMDKPAGCISRNNHHLECGDWEMVWLGMAPEIKDIMGEQFLANLKMRNDDFKKESVVCTSLKQPMTAYKVSYLEKGKTVYRLIAYGTVNGQAILINLGLPKWPKSDEDLPKFAQQILHIVK